jgi:hypothetical protein
MKQLLVGALVAIGLSVAQSAAALPVAPDTGATADQSRLMVTQVHGYYGNRGRHVGWSHGHHYGWGHGHGYRHYRY